MDGVSCWNEFNFLYVACSFIKAKSDVSLEDVRTLIQMGLELFHMSRSKLYAQVLHFVSDELWSFLGLVLLCLLLNDITFFVY